MMRGGAEQGVSVAKTRYKRQRDERKKRVRAASASGAVLQVLFISTVLMQNHDVGLPDSENRAIFQPVPVKETLSRSAN